MKKDTLKTNLENFQDSKINTLQQHSTTGGYISYTVNRRGQPTKVMMGDKVLYECCGNGNGAW